MTVVIALLMTPLLTDYPLQSKHLFITREQQLIAVSFCPFQRLGLSILTGTGMADSEGKCWYC